MKNLILLMIILCLSGCKGNSPASLTDNILTPTTPTPATTQSNQQPAIETDSKVISKETENNASPKATQQKASSKANSNSTESQTPVQKPEQPQTSQQIQQNSSQTLQLKIVGDSEILNIVVAPNQGESVFDLLKRVTKEQGIKIKSRGFGSFAYVESIAGLKEFDQGPSSGWTYYVNGEMQQVGAGQTKVKAGDVIEWKYTK